MPSDPEHRGGVRATAAGPPVRPGSHRQRGFSLLEVLIAGVIIALVAMAGVLSLVRRTQGTNWVKERVFANQKALSLLAEMRAHVAGSPGVQAASLDRFDDGVVFNTSLTTQTPPGDPLGRLAPDHPISGNIRDLGVWRWSRQVSVRPFGTLEANDRRLVTARIYRRHPDEDEPGSHMAEVSSLVQSLEETSAPGQSYDLYVLAIENAPGWALAPDARRSVVQSALTDLQTKNPGLQFDVHWITQMGYGRNLEYVPYANEERLSTDDTPWLYTYPGRLPDGGGLVDGRYYDASQIAARINLDGVPTPVVRNDHALAEPFTDSDGSGGYSPGEPYNDLDGSGTWQAGNPLPYALADVHNHCLRAPEAQAHFDARVAAGLARADEPPWHLLLDAMVATPERFRNALFLNLHAEVLPMPPVRNVSDACRDPEAHPGWRAVSHPETLQARRVAGDEAASGSARYRVHAWKASFEDASPLMTQEEPYVDADASGTYDPGEGYDDWNGNGTWDVGVPLTLCVPGADFSWNANGPVDPSLIVRRLAGGIDADGSGTPSDYADWSLAPRYPETYVDTNANGIHDVAETWLDLDGDGARDEFEPYQELDGNGQWTAASESLTDANGNGRHDRDRPAERFTDTNGNGRWDAAEPWWDRDGDGAWTPPTAPVLPWVAWDPAAYGSPPATAAYVAAFGEPFRDLDGDGTYDPAEPLVDGNGNGVWDGGFRRGEMWYSLAYDAAGDRTILGLHGTPLEAPRHPSGRGLPATARLYDMDHVPCPTPATRAGADRFERDLYDPQDVPKNTARWTVEMPPWALRRALESAPGARDGDREDRLLVLETRIGTSLGTGRLWPVRQKPANRSVTYVYYCANAQAIPYSERHQFQGDPRHMPYADLDAAGSTFPNAYNWYFDDLRTSGDASDLWLAFDPARLRAGWLGRCAADAPRLLGWLRTALTRSEAVWTNLPGFGFRLLSLGGEIGYGGDWAPLAAVPMSGVPFGLTAAVSENDLSATAPGGNSAVYGRSNDGADAGLRSGGYWWSKPWLGELHPDAAYATQWVPWGNLRAAVGTAPLTYRLVRRNDVTAAQQPAGTRLQVAHGDLGEEGCTSFFNTGSAGATFHHRTREVDGRLMPEGFAIGSNYGIGLPTNVRVAHPFRVATDLDGAEGPEFPFVTDHPRHAATVGASLIAQSAASDAPLGSALVRLADPASGNVARVVVTGWDPVPDGGADLMTRYATVSVLHSLFFEGLGSVPRRIRQVPRVELLAPTSLTRLDDPSSIELKWTTQWTRWDGRPYVDAYPSGFSEPDAELAYHLLFSTDGGRTWINMLDGSPTSPGVLPRVAGAPDPLRTLPDVVAGGDERWTWTLPPEVSREGNYPLRIEAHRRAEPCHHGFHQETVYVER